MSMVVLRESLGMQSSSMPLTASLTTLCISIGMVIRMAPKKEVQRVHARRVIAPMADEHPIGDFPVVQFPRHSMRIETDVVADAHVAVAISVSVPQPGPTGLLVLNLHSAPKLRGKSGSPPPVVQSSQMPEQHLSIGPHGLGDVLIGRHATQVRPVAVV